MKFLSIPVFLLSLTVGLLFVYLFNPDPKVIFVYPTPDNVNELVYKDKNSTCHKFDANEVSCPSNLDEIDSIPTQ